MEPVFSCPIFQGSLYLFYLTPENLCLIYFTQFFNCFEVKPSPCYSMLARSGHHSCNLMLFVWFSPAVIYIPRRKAHISSSLCCAPAPGRVPGTEWVLKTKLSRSAFPRRKHGLETFHKIIRASQLGTMQKKIKAV